MWILSYLWNFDLCTSSFLSFFHYFLRRCHNDVSGTEIVRITGACFHPACFTCVECDKKLVHESFISDDKFNIYCEDDYNRKKACKCSYCKKPIVPRPGEKTVPRLRALGKDFHPNCFKCEVCLISKRQFFICAYFIFTNYLKN